MLRNTITLLLIFIFGFGYNAFSQNDVTFKTELRNIANGEADLVIKAAIPAGIQLYASQKSEADLLYSTIEFDKSSLPNLVGKLSEKTPPKSAHDAALDANASFFTDSAVWVQRVKLPAGNAMVLKGTVNYLYKKGDEYPPGEYSIRQTLEPATAGLQASSEAGSVPGLSGDSLTATGATDAYNSTLQSQSTNAASEPLNSVQDRSLWWIFMTSFAGGLLALITPCIYSMIPVTVSFFTKRSGDRASGIKNAVYYSVSIMAIFTLLGFAITLIFGPAALNKMVTNWVANLFFFAVFLIFGFSFLGAFELTLPSRWTSSADSKAGLGSFGGIFFMALTLVLVSFSCTGPIIGSLLPLITQGGYFGPLVGFFGFSLALALPFSFFAFFPSKLNALGKSGGWLNAVKVVLGFLELALALKFLSNADLVKGWRILDREVFIGLWVVIFGLTGFYLLGKLKFRHDDDLPKNDYGLPHLTVTRLMFAIITLAFTVYMIPGMWGAPLKAISAFVPPMGTQDFVMSSGGMVRGGTASLGSGGDMPHPKKYYERMKIYEPEVAVKYGLVSYFDYKEALEVARQLDRPLMLDFTGINCVNCRKMEGQVWSDPEVMRRMKEDFVVASLFVDVHDIDLAPDEQYLNAQGKRIETLGDYMADFQISRFGANVQPYYFFLDNDEKRLIQDGYGYDPSIPKFIELLEKAKVEYKKGKENK